MIEGFAMLATYGIAGGGAVGNFLYELENIGVFSYVLPFLMIFAVIYAILSKARVLGTNQAVQIIVSLAVALMALQFQFVSYFFSEIFPRLGIVLSLILVFMIILGLFVKWDSKGAKWGFGLLGGIAGVVIVVQSFEEAFGWDGNFFGGGSFGWWFDQYSTTIIVVILVLACLIGIPLAGKGKNNPQAQAP